MASDDLHLAVDGVGAIRLPVSARQARQLIGVAKPAPFGRGRETLIDTGVRDTFEIARSRIRIDGRAWRRTLRPALEHIRDDLGLTGGVRLSARLQKMLVYEAGQFFRPHQDSERADDMVGSLVVILPSHYDGGALVVEHRGQKKTYRRASGDAELSLIAFYSDCRHEVRPVRSGYRIALSYDLRLKDARHRAPRLQEDAVARLAESIEAYFSTPIRPRYGNRPPQPPDRLVCLLDHEYSRRSLAWSGLKSSDRLRVETLCDVANRLDCDRYLALADVHETWSCEDEDLDWPERHHGWYVDDEMENDESDDEVDASVESDSYRLTDLIESGIELRHWVGEDGASAPTTPGFAGPSETCQTRPTCEFEPFRSEHEGWMGNYGNTVDRWYHRAALVLWPRERTFVIRAKLSPLWAAQQLQGLAAAGKLPELRDRARSLLPFWTAHASGEEQTGFAVSVFEVAAAVDDPGLAAALVEPLDPARIDREAARAFADLVTRHGGDWGTEVLNAWTDTRKHAWLEPSLGPLAEIAAALHAEGGREGNDLARWILDREVRRMRERLSPGVVAWHWPRPRVSDDLLADLGALFEAAARLEYTASVDALVGALTDAKTGLPPLALVDLLRHLRAGSDRKATARLGVGALYDQVLAAVAREDERPRRDADDWSIEGESLCSCRDCKELEEFLRAPDRCSLDWKLAKPRRRHVHEALDRKCLPVRHETLRQGSPFTLQLRKSAGLFAIDAAYREEVAELRHWLEKEARSFGR
ncbi:MAG: 2OG-Fe(II) oxygenase [Myxococcota bacterium]|nr:2OG-Fe(II) oxygenase [Myxococcota bacterium]